VKDMRINFVLAALIALTALVNYFLQPDYSRPNWDFLPDMQYSPAYGAYSRNPSFADGRTLQEPVAGTLARGETPFHYQATPEELEMLIQVALPTCDYQRRSQPAVSRTGHSG